LSERSSAEHAKRPSVDNNACGKLCEDCNALADRSVRLQLVALSAISAIIALEPSSLEMPAFNAPQNILRWGARSRLRSMLCAILVASSAAIKVSKILVWAAALIVKSTPTYARRISVAHIR